MTIDTTNLHQLFRSAATAFATAQSRILASEDSLRDAREQWKAAGEYLDQIRDLHQKDDRAFGRACDECGIPAIAEMKNQVRSDLMWWSRLTEEQRAHQKVMESKATTISSLREMCKRNGIGTLSTVDKVTNKKTEGQAKPKGKYSGFRKANEFGMGLPEKTGQVTANFKAEAKERFGVDVHDPAQENELLRVVEILKAERAPDGVDDLIAEVGATLTSETAKARYAKAIAKSNAALEGRLQSRLTQLQKSFDKQVADEVKQQVEAKVAEQVGAERKRAADKYSEGMAMLGQFNRRRNALRLALTEENIRFLLNCLHPDRAPEDRKDRFAKAFDMVKGLEPFIEKLETV